MSRRIAAVFALCLMSNATLASTAWACASAMSATAAAAAAAPAHARHPSSPAGRHRSGAPSPHRAPCGTPGGLDCCSALTPCTAVLDVAGPLSVPTPAAGTTRIAAPGLVAPATPDTSPDPPPPKA